MCLGELSPIHTLDYINDIKIHYNGSYLYFRNRRNDGGFWFEVSQVHGSGEQQQRWRNVLLQVQVQPLSG